MYTCTSDLTSQQTINGLHRTCYGQSTEHEGAAVHVTAGTGDQNGYGTLPLGARVFLYVTSVCPSSMAANLAAVNK